MAQNDDAEVPTAITFTSTRFWPEPTVQVTKDQTGAISEIKITSFAPRFLRKKNAKS